MKRKRLKILKRFVLFTLIVSTLLGTFSIFSSADHGDDGDSADEETMGTWAYNVPLYTFYRSGTDFANLRDTSLWPTPDSISFYDRICFGLMGTGSVSEPWHIYPYIQGQEHGSDIVQDYNKLVDDMGYTSWNNFYSRSGILNSRTFQPYISYSLIGGARYEFIIEFRVKDVDSWTYDWLPIYQIRIEYINDKGEYNGAVPTGTFEKMGVFNSVAAWFDSGTTNEYYCFDVGILQRYLNSPDSTIYSKGVKIITHEYFYNNNDIGYPTGEASGIGYQQNLYNSPGFNQQPFISYGYNYYFHIFTDDFNSGFSKGMEQGYDIGYNNGYDIGRSDGVSEGSSASSNYNAVDGLITLGQLPGVFISNMLDFELFGINLASTVKVIFTLLIVAFLIVLILKFLL